MRSPFSVLLIALMVMLAGPLCSAALHAQEMAPEDMTVVVLYDLGGKYDKSFNEAALNGAERWAKETGARYRDFEPTSETQFEQALKRYARRKADIIIGVGIAYTVAMRRVAPEFPDTRFMVIDAAVDEPNVRFVTFKEHEGSFIVGALAAMKTKTGKIGFMGGMDIPLIRKFSHGYLSGARHIRPDIELVENYVGTTPAAWSDPIKASELARGQYQRGVDIIFHASGPSGLGVIQAAKDQRKLAIGVDSNQNGVAPGYVLTSMLKRVDLAVYDAIKDVQTGQWSTGQVIMGLSENGVDYAVDRNNEALVTPEDRQILDDLKAKIVSGAIVVEDITKN